PRQDDYRPLWTLSITIPRISGRTPIAAEPTTRSTPTRRGARGGLQHPDALERHGDVTPDHEGAVIRTRADHPRALPPTPHTAPRRRGPRRTSGTASGFARTPRPQAELRRP